MISPFASIVSGWQTVQCVRSLVETCGNGGGVAWHVPHAASPLPPVQTGAWFDPPAFSVAPWQYVLLQRVPSNVGVVAPWSVASKPQRSFEPPGCWCVSGDVGFTWHSPQSIAPASAPTVTCALWAPTERRDASVRPARSTGGAPVPLSPPPWHRVHPVAAFAAVPSLPALRDLLQPDVTKSAHTANGTRRRNMNLPPGHASVVRAVP